jgi:hypothetical protein
MQFDENQRVIVDGIMMMVMMVILMRIKILKLLNVYVNLAHHIRVYEVELQSLER